MSDENKIYVGNLPFKVRESELENFFNDCGNITDCIVIIDKENNRSKGFGFVTFDSAEAVQKAITKNGQKLEDRELRINVAQQRPPRPRRSHG